ncbi:MAG: hypothetical protein ACKV19_16080 [Verrucomicrobiales bacterium]
MALGTFFTVGHTFVDMEHFAHGHQEWLRTAQLSPAAGDPLAGLLRTSAVSGP